MHYPLSTIIRRLVDETDLDKPLSGVAVSRLFQPAKTGAQDMARNLNAAFWIALSGPGHPLHEQAEKYLQSLRDDSKWSDTASFFLKGIQRISEEVTAVSRSDRTFRRTLEEARFWRHRRGTDWNDEARRKIWGVFFPEGVECLGDADMHIASIRSRRRIRITRLNPEPVRHPSRELLFMSNVLVTMPRDPANMDDLPCSRPLIQRLKGMAHEKQRYWYDHPIQIGVATENNEAVYGLRGLNDAIAFEKQRGGVHPDHAVTCLLSVSVTHPGLHGVVKNYLQELYASTDPFPHLKIYLFSEVDAGQMVDEVLAPAAKKYLKEADADLLARVFGVDGEYGRHYSFLKALSAYWQVLIDPHIRGSFKIDLDQVFDEEVLVAETGMSALEHFVTPLWGAEGVDADGRGVELGMMAGALVNAGDIHQGLFTPDVPMPDSLPDGEAVVFYSQLPQAVSTRAEMMAKYGSGMMDGIENCLHRVHVTGGACAALVGSIRRHRPFTPTWIGRAEDQASLLSCLFKHPDKNLRYLHRPGLIMRHDKAVFAGEAVKGAKTGKYIGDLARTLLFSYYAQALPWTREEIKRLIDPFTGCFVSRIPITVVYLRLGLKVLAAFAQDDPEKQREGLKVTTLAAERLETLMQTLAQTPNPLMTRYWDEKRGWDIFYDVLDSIEEGLAQGDAFAASLQKRAREKVSGCLVRTGR